MCIIGVDDALLCSIGVDIMININIISINNMNDMCRFSSVCTIIITIIIVSMCRITMRCWLCVLL